MTARLYLNDVPSFPIPSFSQPALSSQVLEYTLPLFRLAPWPRMFPRFLCSTGAESPSLCFWLPSCPLCACRCCTPLRRSGPTHRAYRSAELPAPHGTGSRRPSRRRAQQKKKARPAERASIPSSPPAQSTPRARAGEGRTPQPRSQKKRGAHQSRHTKRRRGKGARQSQPGRHTPESPPPQGGCPPNRLMGHSQLPFLPWPAPPVSPEPTLSPDSPHIAAGRRPVTVPGLKNVGRRQQSPSGGWVAAPPFPLVAGDRRRPKTGEQRGIPRPRSAGQRMLWS